MNCYALVDKLERQQLLKEEEYIELIKNRDEELSEYLFSKAERHRRVFYGNEVYIRGMIRFSNYCREDCSYCEFRCSNEKIQRYRLTPKEVLRSCREGYEKGIRTFVLNSGADLWYSAKELADLIKSIKREFPDCAITLSCGTQDKKAYQMWKKAGADRYIIYHKLPGPGEYTLADSEETVLTEQRQYLLELKEIGFQVGCGFMVGTPGQTLEDLAKNMLFIRELNPEMVNIEPYIHDRQEAFSVRDTNTIELTKRILALTRLTVPTLLMPVPVAFDVLGLQGHEMGIKTGCNIIMPDISPNCAKREFIPYDLNDAAGEEEQYVFSHLVNHMKNFGYYVAVSRGDHIRVREFA